MASTAVDQATCEADGKHTATSVTHACVAKKCAYYWKTVDGTSTCVTKDFCEADGKYEARDDTMTCDMKECDGYWKIEAD